ncbi:hypothetical protein GX586_03900 [bacterium]|nr:hypothetical protein [bacterium]
MFLRDWSSLVSSAVRRNKAGETCGGVSCNPRVSIRNCLIAGNTADLSVGGMSMQEQCVVQNTSIVGNRAPLSQAIRGDGGGSLVNVIAYHNAGLSGGALLLLGSNEYRLVSCCLQETNQWMDSTSFVADPHIASLAAPYLLAGSPCVDTGTNASLGVERDLFGGSRVVNGVIDVGCGEQQEGVVTGAFSLAMRLPCLSAPIGYPMEFQAEVKGAVKGLSWAFDEQSAASGGCCIAHCFDAEGAHSVVLSAWNDSLNSTIATTVFVGVTATNYVSTVGQHVPPFADWQHAATNVQDAVTQMPAVRGVILVDTSVYALSGEVVVNKGITIAGMGRPEETVLRYDGPASVSARCVRIDSPGVILRHLTFCEGKVLGAGGGVYCPAGGVIDDCVVVSNRSYTYGGGVCFANGGALMNSRVSWNTSLGGCGAYMVNGVTSNCLFSFHSSAIEDNAGHIVDCTFTRNCLNGGGTVLSAHGSVVERCSLIRNGAVSGFDLIDASVSILRGCLVAENRISIYGGTLVTLACSILENCTIASNRTFHTLPDLYSSTGVNCIVYCNQPSHGNEIDARTLFMQTCADVAISGTGNTNWDPLFMDVKAGNWRLRDDSPCVNAGTNLEWMATAWDLDGMPRIIDGIVDLGAFERVPEPATAFVLLCAATCVAARVRKEYHRCG